MFGVLVCLVQQLLHLVIGGSGGGIGAVEIAAAVQILVAGLRQSHEAEAVAHAVLHDHLPGQIRRPLNIVGSAGGLGGEHHLLRGAAAQQGLHFYQQLRLGAEEFFLLRHLHGIAQGAGGMGHNRNLGHGLAMLTQGGHQGVTHLVVGDNALFNIRQDGSLLLGTGNDHLKTHQQILLGDSLAALTHGPQSRLVDQVGQIRAHGPGGGLGDLLQIHILCQTDILRMHPQGLIASVQIGAVHDNPAVEASGPEQSLI